MIIYTETASGVFEFIADASYFVANDKSNVVNHGRMIDLNEGNGGSDI